MAVVGGRMLGISVILNRAGHGTVSLLGVSVITITIYFIHPSGILKLSFDCTTKNISQ